MANIYDMVFVIQFIFLVGIFLYQMWQLMHQGKIYEIRISFIIIILVTVAWFMGMQVVLLETSKAIYAILFQLESLFFVLAWLFFFFDIIFSLQAKAQDIIRKPFNSKEIQKSLGRG